MSEGRMNKGPGKPRVTMKVEVERNGALVKEELPFEMLVMANLSGDAEKKDLIDRKEVQINNDNFDRVMQSLKPKLDLDIEVEDKTVSIKDLVLDSMESFSPGGLVEQLVEKDYGPVAELWKLRQQLIKIKTEIGTNKQLEKKFDQWMKENLPKK